MGNTGVVPAPRQFSHHVKAETVVVLHTDRANAEVHAAGCAHQSKADYVSEPRNGAQFVERTTTIFVDDFFYVAPCARKAG